MWSMINQWTQEAKKEERETIINEINNEIWNSYLNNDINWISLRFIQNDILQKLITNNK
jgi:hypothetical protein